MNSVNVLPSHMPIHVCHIAAESHTCVTTDGVKRVTTNGVERVVTGGIVRIASGGVEHIATDGFELATNPLLPMENPTALTLPVPPKSAF